MTESGSDRPERSDEVNGPTPDPSTADAGASMENILRLLAEGRIVVRIENVETMRPDVDVQRLADAMSRSTGLGRRLARAAYTWLIGCPAQEPYRPPDR